MPPIFVRSRTVTHPAALARPAARVTREALLEARRRGLESSTAMLPAPPRQRTTPIAALPPELDATRAPSPPREQERVDATATAAPAPAHRVLLPDGTARDLSRTVVAGRAPIPGDDTDALALRDPTRSVSRVHARLEPTGAGLVVVDLGSANGTTVRHRDGSLQDVTGEASCIAPPGSTIHLGDVALTVASPPPRTSA